jgi:uncharacterized protein (TIGR00725 family)
MIRRPIVGVVGSGAADAVADAQAREVGRRIAAAGALLLCGGRGGVMEAAARGARESGGHTIGILPFAPGEGEANRYVDCAVFSGLGDGRNYLNACTSDVLIALRGGPGTLSEIALALKIGVPVVFLDAWDFLAGQPALGATPTARAGSPQQAVAAAYGLLGLAPGEPFTAPLGYPDLPGQSAQREQLLRFLAEEKEAAAARPPVPRQE